MADAESVVDLVAMRRLLRVRTAPGFVVTRIKQATANVDSAKLISQSNPRAAVTLAYDAIRFVVDAHMHANGYRFANEPGAHRTSVSYARTEMVELLAKADLDDYEVLRDVRNRIEYPDPTSTDMLSATDAEEVVATAGRVVTAIATWWLKTNR
jgi:hypothetical protein